MRSNDLRRLEEMLGVVLHRVSLPEIKTAEYPAYSVASKGEIVGLNLSNLHLSQIPVLVFHLEWLQELRVYGNFLYDLPAEIGKLHRLRALYLGANRIERIPPVLSWISSLEVLGLNNNLIVEVPESLAQSRRLRTLSLSHNRIEYLPSTLRSLTQLRSVYLGGNRITQIPAWIASLRRLEALHLSKNPLSLLPESIEQLSNLRALDLRETELREVPKEVFQLAGLEILELGGTPIQTLQPEIDNLRDLKRLSLNGTRLSQLPPTLRSLSKLESLDLSALPFATFPPEVLELKNLKILNLSGTHLRGLPRGLSRLGNLEELDLSGAGLIDVPADVFLLPKLRRLNLVENQISRLSPEITRCQLEVYWHSEGKRNGIFLRGNPLEAPPVEIVTHGSKAVKQYFASELGEQRPLNEIKVLFVGEGGAGKTSIVKRLIDQPFLRDEPQTHGINIQDAYLGTRKKRIKTHYWDFGGQEIMHATHQFFLSKRSIYVLVLDGRKDERTEYWLKHIESFGGDSPILIVMNKIDENPAFDVNRRFLKEKYPNIVDFYRISCADDTGIDEFRRGLAGSTYRVREITTAWTRPWFSVKQSMESMTDNYISLDAFTNICATMGVSGQEAQDTLLEFLHDLGVVLHFRDLPLKDTNVINPRWVTEGVYRIVNSELISLSGGMLHLNWLSEFLDQDAYPAAKHNFLIELMKKFELCYQLDPDRVLLPSLLPIEEPGFEMGKVPVVRVNLKYDFLPKSILPRFLVKMHDDIDQTLRWRTGAVLRNSSIEATAFVRADEDARIVEIVVGGEQRRDYLAVILFAFREINKSFQKLRVTERIPLPDMLGVSVSFDHLTKLERRGIERFMPDGADREYDVRDLLGTVYVERRTEQQILQILQELRDGTDTEQTLAEKANHLLMLQPNVFGIGVNINALVGRLFKRT